MTQLARTPLVLDPGHWDEKINRAVLDLESTLGRGTKRSIRQARRRLLNLIEEATDTWIQSHRPDIVPSVQKRKAAEALTLK